MNLERAIEYFLSAKRAEGRADATITTYTAALYTFARTMPDVTVVADIDHLVVREYIRRLQDGGTHKDISIASRVRHLKAFCSWLVTEEVMRSSPFNKVKVPTYEMEPVDTITDDELKGLLAQCDLKTDIGRRDAAILMMLFDTGVRVSELSGLKLGDVDLSARIARVRGKGKKHRAVFFSAQTAMAVNRYLARRPKSQEYDYLFVGKKHNHAGKLESNGVRLRIYELARRAGINPRRVHPHAFRHSFATNYLRLGGDPASLQRILGHADVTTTVKNYVHLVTDDLQRKHEQFSPMAAVMSRR